VHTGAGIPRVHRRQAMPGNTGAGIPRAHVTESKTCHSTHGMLRQSASCRPGGRFPRLRVKPREKPVWCYQSGASGESGCARLQRAALPPPWHAGGSAPGTPRQGPEGRTPSPAWGQGAGERWGSPQALPGRPTTASKVPHLSGGKLLSVHAWPWRPAARSEGPWLASGAGAARPGPGPTGCRKSCRCVSSQSKAFWRGSHPIWHIHQAPRSSRGILPGASQCIWHAGPHCRQHCHTILSRSTATHSTVSKQQACPAGGGECRQAGRQGEGIPGVPTCSSRRVKSAGTARRRQMRRPPSTLPPCNARWGPYSTVPQRCVLLSTSRGHGVPSEVRLVIGCAFRFPLVLDYTYTPGARFDSTQLVLG